MSKPSRGLANESAVGAADVVRLLGELDAAATSEILALDPSIAELQEAATRAGGDGDVLGKGGKPMTVKIAQIVEIMNPEADDERPAR